MYAIRSYYVLNEGMVLDPRGVGCVSTVMGEAEVTDFIEAAGRVLDRHDFR